jgi:hypothetical protein
VGIAQRRHLEPAQRVGHVEVDSVGRVADSRVRIGLARQCVEDGR